MTRLTAGSSRSQPVNNMMNAATTQPTVRAARERVASAGHPASLSPALPGRSEPGFKFGSLRHAYVEIELGAPFEDVLRGSRPFLGGEETRFALEEAAAKVPPQIVERGGTSEQLDHARPIAPRITGRDLNGQPRIATARGTEESGESKAPPCKHPAAPTPSSLTLLITTR